MFKKVQKCLSWSKNCFDDGDGDDNDCDGKLDERLSRDCSSDCGAGTESCTLGSWSQCSAPAPRVEDCDGEDNDSNGYTDCQDFACLYGCNDACTDESEKTEKKDKPTATGGENSTTLRTQGQRPCMKQRYHMSMYSESY